MAVKPPVRIIPGVVKNEHRYVATAARGAFRVDRAACPTCTDGLLQPTNDDETRRCDHCGTVVTLDDLAILNGAWLDDTAAQRRDYCERHARLLVQIDLISLALAGAWGAFTGSWSPLIAVGIFSVPMLTQAFMFRYRAWQAATGRVYEAKAPFGDFMRDELRGLTGGRG